MENELPRIWVNLDEAVEEGDHKRAARLERRLHEHALELIARGEPLKTSQAIARFALSSAKLEFERE